MCEYEITYTLPVLLQQLYQKPQATSVLLCLYPREHLWIKQGDQWCGGTRRQTTLKLDDFLSVPPVTGFLEVPPNIQ